MSDNKWVRSISFNRKNEKDIARLKLIGKKSFSRYIKKLLDDEIKRQETVQVTQQPVKAEIPINNGTPHQYQQVVPRSQQNYYQPHQPVYNPMLQQRRR